MKIPNDEYVFQRDQMQRFGLFLFFMTDFLLTCFGADAACSSTVICHLINEIHSSKCKTLFEPRCEKTGLLGFRPGPTQTGLCSHRRWLEAGNFGFR